MLLFYFVSLFLITGSWQVTIYLEKTLFFIAKRDCDSCDTYENELSNVREDLVDHLSAWVVKVQDSQMTRLYTPTKEPAIVFFRHGVPLLFEGTCIHFFLKRFY